MTVNFNGQNADTKDWPLLSLSRKAISSRKEISKSKKKSSALDGILQFNETLSEDAGALGIPFNGSKPSSNEKLKG